MKENCKIPLYSTLLIIFPFHFLATIECLPAVSLPVQLQYIQCTLIHYLIAVALNVYNMNKLRSAIYNPIYCLLEVK